MSGDELPEGWAGTTLSTICTHRSGSSKLIKGRLEAGPGPTLFKAFSASGQDVWCKSWEHEGSAVVVSAVGARCGKAFKADGQWAAIANTHVVWAGPSVDRDFLFLHLNNEQFWERGGSAQPFVKVTATFDRDFSLPPLAEQKRIVAKVEELLARVNAARERLARVPAILKRFRQAVLSAACDGGLTEAWRAAHPETEPAESLLVPPSTSSTPDAVDHLEGMNPPGSWVLARVDRLVKIQNGRAFPSGDYQEDGVKLLRPGNLMRDGGVQWAADNTVSLPARWAVECPDLLLGENELLMNLTAQSLKDEFLGRVCIKRDSDQALLNQRIARFKNLGDHELRPYLFLYFRSRLFRTFVNNLDTGSLIRHMHSKDVARHVLPLPPLEEQDEIVRRVEALFKLADTIGKRVAAATARAERLTQAILAKAFRGELVPTEVEMARREGRVYKPAALTGRSTESKISNTRPPRRSSPGSSRL